MTSMTVRVSLGDLPARKVSALKRRAKELGLTTSGYLRQLVEEDLEIDRRARSTSLEELSKPYGEAFKGMSEGELDGFVERSRRARTSGKRKSA